VSRPHRRSRAALRRELRTRDAFLSRLSEGLTARIAAFDASPAAALEGLKGFARELAIITGNREARSPRRAPLDVGLHVESILDAWRKERGPSAPSGPTLHVEKSGSLVASVDGDLVGTILAELVSNAFKYGRGRPIRVLIEGEADVVRLVVEDEGAGFVATKSTGKLFVRGPGTERVRGFGVGVWLTQALAAEHGGALRYAPRSGGGTRAIVTLKRQAP
jgi:signal transduction histidine kinase